jgi:drug/metabolite transporter superfamily protein YnfA
MSAGKIVAIIAAVILILFGALMIIAATDPSTSNPGAIMAFGAVFIIVGLVIIYFAARQTAKAPDTNITMNVDLPGNVKMDTLKCESCGGTLAPENIQMVAGAPVVTCPFCHTTYQLTEAPKW